MSDQRFSVKYGNVDANIPMNDHRIMDLADPLSPQDAVNLRTLTALPWKERALLSASANIVNLAAVSVTDFDGTGQGETVVEGDRLHLPNQTLPKENGIYVCGAISGSSTFLTRAVDSDSVEELRSSVVAIYKGDNAGKVYMQVGVINTLDTDSIVYDNLGENTIWGAITGTLSSQTDLQAALNLKADNADILKKDGSVALTANWNAGAFGITSASYNGLVNATPSPIATDSYSYPTRVTTTERAALTGMTTGAQVHDVTLNKPYYHNGTGWVELGAGGGGSSVWGAITGTLSSQTDLQTALNLKADNADVLKKDGSVALTANWNAGGYKVTSKSFNGLMDATPSPIATDSYSYPTRVTTTERAALTGMTTGAQVYDVTLNKPYYHNGTGWVEVLGGSVAWGEITGTLSSQTDLQAALNLKADNADILKKDGSVALTANWNAGAFGITSASYNGLVNATPLSITTTSYSYPTRVTTIQKTALTGMTTGAVIHDTDLNKPYYHNGTEWVEVLGGSVAWGAITGTLSNQTNLQTALDLKADDTDVLKEDGSVALTANWNAGAFGITAKLFNGLVDSTPALITTSSYSYPTRVTTTEKTALVGMTTGAYVYNKTLNRPYYYNGTEWVDVGSSVEAGTADGQVLYWDNSAKQYKYTEVTECKWDDTSKRMGFNTSNPTRRIDILDNINPALRLSHTSGSIYADFQVKTDGSLLISNTGAGSIGIGLNALSGNTGTYSIGLGEYCLQGNTQTECCGVGRWTMRSNIGIRSCGYGAFALQNNQGNYTSGYGWNTLKGNTGLAACMVGYSSGSSNTGDYVSGSGYAVMGGNSGDYANGIGYISLSSNSGDYVNGIGYEVMYWNTGDYVSGIGYFTLRHNTADYVNGVGSYALYYNSGIYAAGFGERSLEYNAGGESNGFGHNTLRYNNKNNNTAIGGLSFSEFNDDSGSTKTWTTAIASNRITVTSHSFGTIGNDVNVKIGTSGTLPSGSTGLPSGISKWTIIDENTLESVQYTFDAGTGSGTHTAIPPFSYTNATVVGYNAQPSANNQVRLGDDNVTAVRVGLSYVEANDKDLATKKYVDDSFEKGVTGINAATYTILTSDRTIAVDYTTTGAVTLTLPSAASAFSSGARLLIKDSGVNALINKITINRAGSDTITDRATGETSTIINTNGGAIWMQAKDATTWIVY